MSMYTTDLGALIAMFYKKCVDAGYKITTESHLSEVNKQVTVIIVEEELKEPISFGTNKEQSK